LRWGRTYEREETETVAMSRYSRSHRQLTLTGAAELQLELGSGSMPRVGIRPKPTRRNIPGYVWDEHDTTTGGAVGGCGLYVTAHPS
jgi:hypothetical protein